MEDSVLQLCNICAEERPSLVTCPAAECGEECCQECLQRFVLDNATEPKCMYCKVVYSDDFLYGVMPPSFQDIYRSARVDELLSREKSLLPQTQEYVEGLRNEREVERIREQMESQRKKVNRPRKQATPFWAWKYLYTHPDEPPTGSRRTRHLDSATFKRELKGNKELRAAINDLVARDAERFERETEVYERELEQLYEIQDTLRDIAGAEYAAEQLPARREVAFTKPCPYPECRGYVSSAWKCGLCERYSCSRCHEPKNGRDDPDHVCNEDTVATIALLANDTKPCPNPACLTPITKLSGCDQMWCPTCHWAFSWRTGTRVRAGGVIHNPHFFEHQRSLNNGEIPRQPGDIPGGAMDPCGGVPTTRAIDYALRSNMQRCCHDRIEQATRNAVNDPNNHELRRLLLVERNLCDPSSSDNTVKLAVQRQFFGELCRFVHHLDDVLMPSFPIADTPDMFRHLRGRYLLKEITEHDWRRELVKKTKELDRNRELALVLQFFKDSLVDTLQHLSNEASLLTTESACQQVLTLRSYTVRQLAKLRIKFGTVVPHFGWRSEIRYSLFRDLRRAFGNRPIPEAPRDLKEDVRVYTQYLEDRNFNSVSAKGMAPSRMTRTSADQSYDKDVRISVPHLHTR
mgnify:CR=1 FL=1